MVKRGKFPERRTYLRQYLEDVRLGLVKDVAGDESSLTTGQQILIDRTIGLISVLRCIEESLAEDGVIQAGSLAPVLRESYISYQNTCRLNLVALGLDKRMPAEPTIMAYITEFDAQKAARADKEDPGEAKDERLQAEKAPVQGQKDIEESGS